MKYAIHKKNETTNRGKNMYKYKIIMQRERGQSKIIAQNYHIILFHLYKTL
jgi:hypothetical protein